MIHLAAQAGVRYSIENPRAYIDSNLVGTFNLLELVRAYTPRISCWHRQAPSMAPTTRSRSRKAIPPIIPDALRGDQKSHRGDGAFLCAPVNIPTTAFRFFTVYGPWGRPDMALFKFTKGFSRHPDRDLQHRRHAARFHLQSTISPKPSSC